MSFKYGSFNSARIFIEVRRNPFFMFPAALFTLRIHRAILILAYFFLRVDSEVNAQVTIDTTSILVFDSVTQTTTDFSRYIGWRESGEGSNVDFVFDTLQQLEFEKFMRRYTNPLRVDSGRVIFTDTSVLIKTDTGGQQFTTMIQEDTPWAVYEGWLHPLYLHVLTKVDGKNEMAALWLVDGRSGKSYFIESGWDVSCAPPLLSPKGNYLVTYANTDFEQPQSLLQLFRVKRNAIHYRLELLGDTLFDRRQIDSMVWINEHRMAVSFTSAVTEVDGHEETLPAFQLSVSFPTK